LNWAEEGKNAECWSQAGLKIEQNAKFCLIFLYILILDVVGFGTKTCGSSMPKFYGTIQKPILLKIVPKATIWQPWALE